MPTSGGLSSMPWSRASTSVLVFSTVCSSRVGDLGGREQADLAGGGADGALGDVGARLHAVETDLGDGLVGALARRGEAVSERADGQDAAAADDVAAAVAACQTPRAAKAVLAWYTVTSSVSPPRRRDFDHVALVTRRG
jgi:hypothetical protein